MRNIVLKVAMNLVFIYLGEECLSFIQDVYIFKKYSTKRQLLKTGRLLKTQEYLVVCYTLVVLFVQ